MIHQPVTRARCIRSWLGKNAGLLNAVALIRNPMAVPQQLQNTGFRFSWWDKLKFKFWLRVDEPQRAKRVIVSAIIRSIRQ